MTDLTTTYMGLTLKSPIIVSASPLSEDVDNFKRMEDAGAGAAVMFSLFEEQIKLESFHFEQMIGLGTESFAEALSYFPAVDDYRVGVDRYLEILRQASESVDMPVIASLNGISPDGWVEYAEILQDAGASALELNIFFIPTDFSMDGRAVEEQYLEILKRVKSTISIPVAIKLNPYFSAMGNMALQLADAGADGLVLFNRFYEPDVDVEHLEVVNSLELSRANEIRLPLLWIGMLHGRVNASLAATTGVQSSTEVIKYLLAGADVVMTASALLKNGIGHLKGMRDELQLWAELRGFHSIDEMRGIMSHEKVKDASAYERANYIKILSGYEVG